MGMGIETLKDSCRLGILSKSIAILRSHQCSDETMKQMLLKSFAIDAKTLDELLECQKQPGFPYKKAPPQAKIVAGGVFVCSLIDKRYG